MSDFLLNIAAQLVVALIVFVAAGRFSPAVRRGLTAAISEYMGIDVRYVFSNGKAAEAAIREALANSATVRIFTGRGNEFQADLYTPILDSRQKAGKQTRVLLPDPYTAPARVDWIEQREKELAPIDPALGNGQLRRQIMTSIEHVYPQQDRTLELRLFDLPHIGRIILTDRFAFFTPYAAHRQGRDSRVFQYGRGDTYDAFARFFEMAWASSMPADAARPQVTAAGALLPVSSPQPSVASFRRFTNTAAAAGSPSCGCRMSSLTCSGSQASHHLSRALPVNSEAHQLGGRVTHLPPAAVLLLGDRVGGLRGGGCGILRVVRHRALRIS